eukprot:scaffold2815_cov113-Isochrysis_galbana.AAC.4
MPSGCPPTPCARSMQVAVGKREALSVFGSDYPTHDGTGECRCTIQQRGSPSGLCSPHRAVSSVPRPRVNRRARLHPRGGLGQGTYGSLEEARGKPRLRHVQPGHGCRLFGTRHGQGFLKGASRVERQG